jgi:hypothetical protein
MNVIAIRSRGAGLALVLLAACATPPGRPQQLQPTQERRLDRVELHDTLPSFLTALRRKRTPIPEGPMEAWASYEQAEQRLLAAAGATGEDPGEQRLFKLAASTEAIIDAVQIFEEQGPGELEALAEQVATRMGSSPSLVVGFAVTRGDRALYSGTLDGNPLVVLNARHSQLAKAPARKTAFARELFRAVHRARIPDSPSLGPLASLVFREGACLLAARQLVPDAFEQHLLGVPEEQLEKLRGREGLIAQELLAAFDSARESEAARFFDPTVKDPLLPAGSGPFIADRLYQRLTAELGSADKPLRLTPDELARRARRILSKMAGAP